MLFKNSHPVIDLTQIFNTKIITVIKCPHCGHCFAVFVKKSTNRIMKCDSCHEPLMFDVSVKVKSWKPSQLEIDSWENRKRGPIYNDFIEYRCPWCQKIFDPGGQSGEFTCPHCRKTSFLYNMAGAIDLKTPNPIIKGD